MTEAPHVNHLGGRMYGDGEFVAEFKNTTDSAPTFVEVYHMADSLLYTIEYRRGAEPMSAQFLVYARAAIALWRRARA